MGFKKTKLAVASLVLVSLAACSSNNNKAGVSNNVAGYGNISNTSDMRDMRHKGSTISSVDQVRFSRDNDLDRMDMNNLTAPRNVSTGDLDRNNSMPNSTTEIQPMGKNGFITIAHNSYSTDTPSSRFPHTQRVQQGNYWYYTFVPGTAAPNMGYGTIQQPQYGMVTQPNQRTPMARQTTPAAPAAPKATTPAAPKPTTPSASAPSAQAPAGISQMAQQVINLTNQQRQKNGLPPLKADASLSKVAQTKADDMETKHYFSHTSPTYGSPFDMMRDFGVTYKSAGENIAMGQKTAQEVVDAWMNSEGHRKNILSPNYTNIGVGFDSKGNYWSQMFIGK